MDTTPDAGPPGDAAAPPHPRPKARRTRRSKYPKTHPRYWLNVYVRNGREGKPRYAGIPAAMHEPMRALKRMEANKSYAKQSVKRRRARIKQSQELGETVRAGTPVKDALEVVIRPATRPLIGYVLTGLLFCAGVAFTAAVGTAASRHHRAMERRIANLEAAMGLPSGTVGVP